MIIDKTSSRRLRKIHLEFLKVAVGLIFFFFEAWHTLFCFRDSDLEGQVQVASPIRLIWLNRRKIIGDAGNNGNDDNVGNPV